MMITMQITQRSPVRYFLIVMAIAGAIVCGTANRASAQALTVLPDHPTVTDLDGTPFQVFSHTNFTVYYDVTVSPNWNGAAVIWDWQEKDLSDITQFVFRVKGAPIKIQAEFEDILGGKTIIETDKTIPRSPRVWTINAADITNTDLSRLKMIGFVVGEHQNIPPGLQKGDFTIYVGGLTYEAPPDTEGDVGPSPPHVAELTILPHKPFPQDLDGTAFTQHSSSNFTITYNLNDHDWRGVMVRWDEWAAQDLSDHTNLVFGLKGDPDAVRLEVEYMDGSKTLLGLMNVTDSYQHWHIEAEWIEDAENVRVICFVVNRDLAGPANYEGEITVYVGGLDYTPTLYPATPPDAELTILPNLPGLQDLDGGNWKQLSSSNVVVEYNLYAHLYPGVTTFWEDWAAQDLSDFTRFVFGAMGDPDAIKVEFEYSDNSRTTIILADVTDSYQQWEIDASLIANLQDVRNINFFADWGLAGEGKHEGEFTIFVGGLSHTPTHTASGLTILPNQPGLQELGGADWTQLSSSGVVVDYNLHEQDYPGITIFWEHWSIQDLSAFTQFVFGVMGDPEQIKVEFECSDHSRTTILLDVTDSYQQWGIDASLIANLQDIKNINFLVTGDVAGEENFVGQFSIYVGGLKYGDGPRHIPDSWWDEHDIQEPYRIADADHDGDGTTNWKEYLAGTNPNDDQSFWRIEGSEADPEQGEGFSLHWNAIPGRVYRVERSPNLLESDPVSAHRAPPSFVHRHTVRRDMFQSCSAWQRGKSTDNIPMPSPPHPVNTNPIESMCCYG